MWKCFGRWRSIYVRLSQPVSLEVRPYHFSINIFPDLFTGKTGAGEKILPLDPQSGMIGFFCGVRYVHWQSLQPYLQNNRYECEFSVEEPGVYALGIDVILPHPLEGNGIFVDAFELRDMTETVPNPHTRTVHLAPENTSQYELAQVLVEAYPNLSSIVFNREDALVTHPDVTARNVHVWNAWRWGGKEELRKFAGLHYPPQPNWIWHSFKKDETIWDSDIRDELATNPGPYTSPILNEQGGWWKRELVQIDGVTIHHTLSDSPHATAAYYVQKDGGRPTLPYTFWITQTGEILWCVDLEEGLWHDHCSNFNTHLSVGLAGRLHEYRPSEAQLDAATKLCAWAVDDIGDVKGHMDYYPTVCPGWASAASGYWKEDFYIKLRALLDIPNPPLDTPNTLLTLHMQRSEHGWVEWVRDVQPEVVKLVGEFERAAEVKAVSPHTLVWIRQVDDDTGKYIGKDVSGVWEPGPPPDAAARMFLDTFWPEGETPTWLPYVDIISGLNETIATGNTVGTQHAVAFEVAFSDLVASLGTHVKASLLATAVGNPGHNEVELLLPAARAAIRNGHYLDSHLYFPCNPIRAERWMEEEGLHHHMRSLLSWDPVFASHGLYPMYLAGECGCIGADVREDGRPRGYIDFTAGFRHSGSLNGDWPRYLALLLRHKEMIEEWNRTHGNRFRGMAIFTTVGPGTTWRNFDLYQEQLVDLAAALT